MNQTDSIQRTTAKDDAVAETRSAINKTIETLKQIEVPPPKTHLGVIASLVDIGLGLHHDLCTWAKSALPWEHTTGETETIVKRIDNRQKNRGGERISAEVQDLCFTYWEFGKHNQRIREISKHKTKYAHVFQYYRRELKAIGITTAEEFAKALVLRSKRISRNQGK